MITLYNTLTRRKEIFKPINPPQVGMYVCGITVYDYCHIGHARFMVVFDVLARWLRASGYALTYVRNITDIDDKIIRRAAENGEPINDLTERFIQAMHEDERALNVLPPDQEPRATAHIEGMIAMIQSLLNQGFAYQTSKGDVCFAVRQFAQYGKLSGKSIDELRAGERVDTDDDKKDPLDFVLWKVAKEGEPQWSAPFGNGRPGWHIECSAMSKAHLGNHFDIHGGGQDLQFPHHENEIAQSTCANGETFVNVWLHNGFVTVDEEKMAKSLGNFRTIREVLKECNPEVLRFFLLRSHYRSPLHFSSEALRDSKAALTRIYQTLRPYNEQLLPLHENPVPPTIENTHPLVREFSAAMNDDLNTPMAISVLFEVVKNINKKPTRTSLTEAIMLYSLGRILGLMTYTPDSFFKQGSMEDTFSDKKVEELIAEREVYRRNRNFAEADRIRDELLEQGVVLDDTAQGTTWKRL